MEHIILLTTSFPGERLGSEAAGSFVADFAEELTQRCRVTVLAPSTRAHVESRGNLRIERFAVPKLPLSLLNVSNPVHWVGIFRTLYNGQKALNRLLGKGPVDHILALWALPSGYWARNVYKKHHIPYSVWALGSDIWTVVRIPFVKNILQAVLRDSHKCFADGFLLKDEVESICQRTCEFLPSIRKLPIVKERVLATKPPYRLAFLGRWHPNKGVDLLIAALNLLHGADWEKIQGIQICGGGPLEVSVRTGCAYLRSVGRPVTTRGYLDKAQATELLTQSDYLIIPSRLESIPVVFSDAVQAGCPLISTPVGDLPRLLNSYQLGVLSQDVSSDGLAAAIRTALDRPPQLFKAGLATVSRQFSVDHTCNQFLNTVNGGKNADTR
jgi:glycosyltransferase involved in cell wall biosynthesis